MKVNCINTEQRTRKYKQTHRMAVLSQLIKSPTKTNHITVSCINIIIYTVILHIIISINMKQFNL